MKYFLLLLLISSQAHATWKAYWLGDSNGQLVDALGSNNLTMTNIVPNPSSPTPYQGDRWLGFDFFTPSAFFKIPTAVIPSNTQGKFVTAFRYATEPCCGASAAQTILDIENAGAGRYLTLVFMGIGTGFISDYTNSGGSNTDIRSPVVWSLNSNHLIEVGWSNAGVYIKADGVSIANSATLFDQGAVTNVWMGTQGNLLTRYTQNYLDAPAFSDNITDSYPPIIPSATGSSIRNPYIRKLKNLTLGLIRPLAFLETPLHAIVQDQVFEQSRINSSYQVEVAATTTAFVLAGITPVSTVTPNGSFTTTRTITFTPTVSQSPTLTLTPVVLPTASKTP